jgi:hypothetical protein
MTIELTRELNVKTDAKKTVPLGIFDTISNAALVFHGIKWETKEPSSHCLPSDARFVGAGNRMTRMILDFKNGRIAKVDLSFRFSEILKNPFRC